MRFMYENLFVCLFLRWPLCTLNENHLRNRLIHHQSLLKFLKLHANSYNPSFDDFLTLDSPINIQERPFIVMPHHNHHHDHQHRHPSPPPLPIDKWVNNSSLNYTALHAQYHEVIVCLTIPVGVFGFYYWLLVVLQSMTSLGRCYLHHLSHEKRSSIPRDEFQLSRLEAPEDLADESRTTLPLRISDRLSQRIRQLNHQRRFRMKTLLFEISTLSLNIFLIVQAIQTLRACSTVPGISVLRGFFISLIVGSSFSAVAGVLASFHMWVPALGFLGVGVVVKYISGLVFFLRVMGEAEAEAGVGMGVGSRFRLDFDLQVETGAHIAVGVPWMAICSVALGFVVFGAWLGKRIRMEQSTSPLAMDPEIQSQSPSGAAQQSRPLWFMIFITGTSILTAVFLGVIRVLANGWANVLIGKILGDPWGLYVLRTWWGGVSTGVAGLGWLFEVVETAVELVF
ncbi:hypothetical protein DFH27DRAFT_638855 [Peziza echinospora]|nr:hypothetical protein DFH27DRAFT_638855 [Peziza echinospora]